MEIPEPTLEVAKGAGEAAGKTAKSVADCRSWGRNAWISGCLPAGPSLGGLCCPCRPAGVAASLLGEEGAPLHSFRPAACHHPRVGPEAVAHRSLCLSHPEEAFRAGQGLLREDQDEEVKEETLVQAPVVSFLAWRRVGAWMLRELTPLTPLRGWGVGQRIPLLWGLEFSHDIFTFWLGSSTLGRKRGSFTEIITLLPNFMS